MSSSSAAKKTIQSRWRRFADSIIEKVGIEDALQAALLSDALASVPRDMFLPEALNLRASEDNALPIGYGQTISKPSTVVKMLACLRIAPGMRVLEIGCGSGYASALMAAAGCQVYAVEYVGILAQATRKRLDALDFHNILIRRGDGRRGWADNAPYDAILVSAAFTRIEDELLAQLKCPGGRLIAPIGEGREQALTLWEATSQGLRNALIGTCSFVEGQE